MASASGSGFRWWYIPLGCGGMLALFAAFAVAMFVGIMGMVRESEPYSEGMRLLSADADAGEVLGEPIEPGWFVSGSIETSGSGGRASLAIPVVGAHASGTLYVEANKVAGQWNYAVIELEPEGGGPRIPIDGM